MLLKEQNFGVESKMRYMRVLTRFAILYIRKKKIVLNRIIFANTRFLAF